MGNPCGMTWRQISTNLMIPEKVWVLRQTQLFKKLDSESRVCIFRHTYQQSDFFVFHQEKKSTYICIHCEILPIKVGTVVQPSTASTQFVWDLSEDRLVKDIHYALLNKISSFDIAMLKFAECLIYKLMILTCLVHLSVGKATQTNCIVFWMSRLAHLSPL